MVRLTMNRNHFYRAVVLMAFLCATQFCGALRAAEPVANSEHRLLFTSQGKTGLIEVESGDVRYLDFQSPNQATWQPGPCFADGQRMIVLSMEPRRDGPGKSFDEYYTQTPTHLWIHDLKTGALDEICDQPRLATFVTPQLLIAEDRLLVQVVRDKVGQTYSVKLDGTDPHEFTRAGEGLPYGLSLSPDGTRVAYHLASPQGYQIWTCYIDGTNRVQVAAAPEHLYFGTSWSPDGEWILYVDCHYAHDPGHDWADVCIGRARGGEHRVLTQGQAMWFAATYGNEKTRGGGSNVPAWTHDGKILFPRRTADARVPWEYQSQRPDTDHFNRDFKPDSARGGTQICLLDPQDQSITALTAAESGVWDFRGSESSDGRYVVFCRAATGEAPAVWVMDRDGKNPRRLTQGVDDLGADHPRWLPQAK